MVLQNLSQVIDLFWWGWGCSFQYNGSSQVCQQVNPQSLFSEHASHQQHITCSVSRELWLRLPLEGGGRSQPQFSCSHLLPHVTTIRTARVLLLRAPMPQGLLWSPICGLRRKTQCSWTSGQGALNGSKIQQHIQQPAACWALQVHPGLPTPKNWDESRWERGKGSVCVFIFYQAQLFGKKKRRIVLRAGALPSSLPSLASPSTPPSVQTA